MPLDPTKLQQVLDRGDLLTKRFDALKARRAKADEEKAQRKVLRDAEEQIVFKEAEAIASPTPDQFRPTIRTFWSSRAIFTWYYTDLELGYEREELRQGGLSKDRGLR